MEMHLNYGYWHGLTLVLDKSNEFVELVGFLADKDNYAIIEFYSKYTSVLERFANQFKKRFAEEIEISPTDSKKIAIFADGIDLHIPDKKLLQDKQAIQAFYRAIGLDDEELLNKFDSFEKLTLTEKKVMNLTSFGYTAKKIAKELAASPKTIESHIYNIKRKTKLHYKHDLIREYNKLF